MAEGFGKGVKFAMFLSNLIIFFAGIVVFGVGVWTLADKSFMDRLLGTNTYIASAVILIVAGVIVSIISLLGTIGAYKEIRCILMTYFIVLFMLFVVLIVSSVLGYVFRKDVDERMQSELVASVRGYGNETGIKDAWDSVHKAFNCCGVVANRGKKDTKVTAGYIIWETNNYLKEKGLKVPESCCKPKDNQNDKTRKQCAQNPTSENVYTEGCHKMMKEFCKDHALVIAGIAIGIACILIIGMVLSCALFLMIR